MAGPARVPEFPWAVALLIAASLGLGLLGNLPLTVAVVLAVAGPSAGEAIRRSGRSPAAGLLPLVGAAGALSAYASVSLVTELYAGVVGLGVLLWLADDPNRGPRRLGRGLGAIGVPGLAVAIAWASALLLPASAAPVGISAFLLVAVVAAAALLLRSPRAYDRELGSAS